MALVVQVRLESGTTVRTCWIPARVRAGDQVTLKNDDDPGRWWRVVAVDTDPRDLTGIPRGWANNI